MAHVINLQTVAFVHYIITGLLTVQCAIFELLTTLFSRTKKRVESLYEQITLFNWPALFALNCADEEYSPPLARFVWIDVKLQQSNSNQLNVVR